VNKQSVAFSATFTDELLASLDDFVHQPQIVKLTQDLPTLEGKKRKWQRHTALTAIL
jgi:ATP-dependent RNA helicase DDX20